MLPQRGVIAWHLSGDGMSASAIRAMPPRRVADLFEISSHGKSEQSGVPGVTMSKPGVLGEWVARIHRTLLTLGAALDAEGCASPGALVLDAMRDITARDRPAMASRLAEALVRKPALDAPLPAVALF